MKVCVIVVRVHVPYVLSFCHHSNLVRAIVGCLAMAASSPVALGCLPTEVVLRGGRLQEPLVLTGLRVVNGKQFVTLCKASSVLNRFLCKSSVCKRPLAGTLVFEQLTKLRNEAYQRLLAQAASEPCEPQEEQADLAALLDLDASPGVLVASLPVDASAAKRIRLPKRLAAQLPKTLTVTMEASAGMRWEVTLLAECARKSPAMEASAANFSSLLEWVEADLHDDHIRRLQHGALVATEDRRSPRGPKHAREYFVKGTWVTKIREAEPAPYGDGRRFRTLKRRGSDEEVRPKNSRRRAGRPSGSRAVASVPDGVAGVGAIDGGGDDGADCLGV
jgi:hypothetical protein